MSKLRDSIKKITYFLNLRWMVVSVRKGKYIILDSIGYFLFAIARILKVVPTEKPLNENLIKRILVVRNDRVGDLILSTPAFRALRHKYYDAEIDLLVNDYAKDLVANNSNVNRVFADVKEIKDKKYDLAIALHAGYKQNKILFQSGASWRVGFVGSGGGYFLTHKIKDDRREKPQHEVDFTLRAVQEIGANIDVKELEVSITDRGELFADKFYKKHNLSGHTIVVHPGARQECLRWDQKGFANLCDRLIKEDRANVILTGTAGEKEIIQNIVSMMNHKPVICLDSSLTELVSILKRAKMYIGNMTGPMHIASALNISVVAISGLVDSLDDARYWGPRCDDYEAVCKNGIESITVEEVYKAAKSLAGRDVA